MGFLLGVSRAIDALNAGIGRTVYWLILVAVAISSGNAVIRYALHMSSNAWLEVQWYLFSAVFLLCAGYTLLRNEHIRIDIVAGMFSRRTQVWIDVFGLVAFLLPMSLLLMWLSWPVFTNSFCSSSTARFAEILNCVFDSTRWERSTDAGGLVRWPVKILMPIGFFLLSLQGVSELIKRLAFLQGLIAEPGEKQQAHGAEA